MSVDKEVTTWAIRFANVVFWERPCGSTTQRTVLAALRTAGGRYRLRLASAATFLVPPFLAALRTVALGAGTITLWIGMMEG